MSRDRRECPICSAGQAPEINRMSADGSGTRAIAGGTGFTRWAVRQHLEKCVTPPFAEGQNPPAEAREVSIDDVQRPLSSDEEILIVMGMDPEEFELVGGVNVSARTLASGDMLYSYRAKVRKVEPVQENPFNLERVNELFKFTPTILNKDVNGDWSSAYVIALADPQLGKSGTDEAVKNLQTSVVRHVDRIKRMISSGVKINRVVLCYMGDEIEGIAGNYANQTATVELNLSQQLELDFELRIWAHKYIIDEVGLPMDSSSVLSNHGDSWVRMGGNKPVMGQSDNASTHVARNVQKAFSLAPGYGDSIEWYIAHDEAAVILTINGVKMYTTHGYLEKGAGTGVEARTVNAMQKQILGNPMGLGDVKVFLTAHYHHHWLMQDRNYTVIGCPALEAKGSSKWLKDMSGIWSEPGAVGFLVGKNQGPMGWNEIAVL